MEKALPGARFIYAKDQAFAPYGCKDDTSLEKRVKNIFKKLLSLQPDIIIIACNTASTFLLPNLRAMTAIPIVGVIPPIKPGALLSTNKVIGLLATPATIKRPYTDNLIESFAAGCKVKRLGSTKLVEMAEAKLKGEKVCLSQLEKEIAPLFDDPKMDVVLLGCTHFPHLLEEMKQCAPFEVHWLDPGEAIARRLKSLASHSPISKKHQKELPQYHTAYCTREPHSMAFVARGFDEFCLLQT